MPRPRRPPSSADPLKVDPWRDLPAPPGSREAAERTAARWGPLPERGPRPTRPARLAGLHYDDETPNDD